MKHMTILGTLLKILRRFWVKTQYKPRRVSLADLALVTRCTQIIRGEVPGREPRLDGGQFPAWGQADLEGRALVWSGPFSFDLDLKYGLITEILPNVYVTDYSRPSWLDSESPDPVICLIIGESATWATLWPST